uniref:Uncharacterized protein n=1 Tax=Panagrolaimus davidi TaxID=227884 RepID=A0A914RD38_9BILA
MISPATGIEMQQTRKAIDKEITYQRRLLQKEITKPKFDAAAMSSSSRPIELIQSNGRWIPSNNESFEHIPGRSVAEWPLLVTNRETTDTMFAVKRNPTEERTSWKFFIVTKTGLYIPCGKE